MNEYDLERKNDLIEIISDSGFNNISSDDVNVIVELENEMTNNKDMLMSLAEDGILSDPEYQGKVGLCFNVFLKKVVEKFGVKFCNGVFDYLPTEELGFLEGKGSNRLESEARMLSAKSADLRTLIEEAIETSTEVGFQPMLSMVEVVSHTSDEVVKEITKEKEQLAVVRMGLREDIGILESNIVQALAPSNELDKVGVDVNTVKSSFVGINCLIEKI